MLKRLLCLCLALMLPGIALAEDAWQAVITWQADEAGAAQYVRSISGVDNEALAKGLAETANSLSMRLHVQEDGFAADVLWDGESIVDLSVYTDDTAGYALSSLWPGYALKAAVSDEEAQLEQMLQSLFTNVNWTVVGLSAMTEGSAWLSSLPVTEEVGSFMGDAYVGGRIRRTYHLDDRDIALLVEGIIMLLERSFPLDGEVLSPILNGVDPYQALRQFNHRAAMENRYDYVLHHVLSSDGATVGISVTVLEGKKQVSTISLGALESGVQLVWGYGLQDVNYYLDAQVTWGEQQAVVLRLFRDGSHAGYRAVRDYVKDALVYELTGSLTIGNGGAWRAEVNCLQPESSNEAIRYVFEHVAGQTVDSYSVKWYLGQTNEPCITVNADISAAEKNAVSLDGLSVLNMTDDNEAQKLEAVVMDTLKDLGIRLFKLVPPTIITQFLN